LLPTRSGLDQGSGQPNTVRLDELDVICAVLGCGAEELLLLPEPETAPQPEPAGGEQAPAVAEPARLRRGRAGGRFLLPSGRARRIPAIYAAASPAHGAAQARWMDIRLLPVLSGLLFERSRGSGRRSRRFKSGHPDPGHRLYPAFGYVLPNIGE
jgi:hypothetical protein